MFKKRALKVSVIKDDTAIHDAIADECVDAISKMMAKNTKPVVVIMLVTVAAMTVSKIAVHTAKTYIK